MNIMAATLALLLAMQRAFAFFSLTVPPPLRQRLVPRKHPIVTSRNAFLRLPACLCRMGKRQDEDHDAVDSGSADSNMTTQQSSLATVSIPTVLSQVTLGCATLLTSIAPCIVLWSEWAVWQTRCGPFQLPDWLERTSYLSVLVVASCSILIRILSMANGTTGDTTGLLLLVDPILDDTAICQGTGVDQHHHSQSHVGAPILVLRGLVQTVECLVLLAVIGAVLVLVHQAVMGETMDGMSGIDLDKCRSRQSFATSL